MQDKRSGRIVVVSHCILDVHCLEDNLSLYPGMEEEVVQVLIRKGVGIYQIPCPELEIGGISRKALPKESYDIPKIRRAYRELADRISDKLAEYKKKGYTISAVIGAECSPTCGIDYVGKWKDEAAEHKAFPLDVRFVQGRGVFMEEFQDSLGERGMKPLWIGIPGMSIRSVNPEAFMEALDRIDRLLY